jgi:hypothetical protein
MNQRFGDYEELHAKAIDGAIEVRLGRSIQKNIKRSAVANYISESPLRSLTRKPMSFYYQCGMRRVGGMKIIVMVCWFMSPGEAIT